MSAFDEFVNGAKKAFDYASVKTNEVERLKFEIVKHIIDTRLAESRKKAEEAAAQAGTLRASE